MMSFLSLTEQRYSVRSFKNLPVEDEKLNYIFDCVRLAPSAVNFQPWKFFVLKTDEAKERVYPSYNRPWLREAPVVILCCADHSLSWKRRSDNKDHADVDVAIAVEHLCLAAAERGLGTCWVCNFDAESIKKAFELPPDLEPVVLVPLGYPSDNDVPEKKRKNISEIVRTL